MRLLRKNVARLEQEANKFAAALLLPTINVSAIVQERGVTFKTCKFVSQLFQTSLTVAAIRCAELSDQKAAFVETRNGVVRSFQRSGRWKDYIKHDWKIGSEALARQLSVQGDREKKGQVSALEWVWDATGRMMLTEESMLMPNYNTVLSLLTQD